MFLILKWISENKFRYLKVNMLSSFSVGWFIFTNISVYVLDQNYLLVLCLFILLQEKLAQIAKEETLISYDSMLQDNNLLAIKANCNYIH